MNNVNLSLASMHHDLVTQGLGPGVALATIAVFVGASLGAIAR